MSNNTPDYENDLLFAPTSADDLNEQGRQSDVLISAIERCEKLEKQLKIAIEALEEYTTFCRHPAEEALANIKELDK